MKVEAGTEYEGHLVASSSSTLHGAGLLDGRNVSEWAIERVVIGS